MLNSILGSGVFGLPSVIAGKLGAASPWAWLVAAVVIGVIMACFAEVASRFRDAGGPYLYARVALGRFAGVQMGWMAYLVRLTASATNANLFVIYLAEFWPEVKQPALGGAVLLTLFGLLATVNYRGVRYGARLSNVFILSKLVPVGLLATAGLALALARGPVATPDVVAGGTAWLEAILLLIFAYGGFESALMPLAEAKDPRRDAPFAILLGLVVITALYTLIQVVVSFTLADAAQQQRPLAAAAGALVGPAGAALLALGALLSVYGFLTGQMVNAPRLTYAMAEHGDLPAPFGRVHAAYRTPHISILVYSGLTVALALSGSFLQNLTLSAVSRLLTYGLGCAALPVLRRRERDPRNGVPQAAFVLPGGVVFAVLGVAFSLVLVTRIKAREAAIMGGVMALAAAHWWWGARRAASTTPAGLSASSLSGPTAPTAPTASTAGSADPPSS